MNYYTLVTYGDEENYSVNERTINQNEFNIYAQAKRNGDKDVVFKNRLISLSSIKGIEPIKEKEKETLEALGIIEQSTNKVIGEKPVERLGNYLERTDNNKNRKMTRAEVKDYLKEKHSEFRKKMGWKDKEFPIV